MKKLFTLLFPLLLLVAGICSCSKPRPKAAVLEISGPPGMCSETAGQEFKGQNLKLMLPPGRYMFRFTAPGCRDQFKLIEMKPGRKEQVKIEFRPATAAAVISSSSSSIWPPSSVRPSWAWVQPSSLRLPGAGVVLLPGNGGRAALVWEGRG